MFSTALIDRPSSLTRMRGRADWENCFSSPAKPLVWPDEHPKNADCSSAFAADIRGNLKKYTEKCLLITMLDGETVLNRAFLETIQIDETQKSPQLLESVCSLRLRTWSRRFVVALLRCCSGRCSQRRIEHHRPAQRFLTADWHTGFNVDLDARHDSAASTRAHRDAARLFA